MACAWANSREPRGSICKAVPKSTARKRSRSPRGTTGPSSLDADGVTIESVKEFWCSAWRPRCSRRPYRDRPPYGERYSYVMRPLRYSINVTLDGCCDHRAILPDEDLHRHAAENLGRADALLFGRVTYEMMEAGWRQPASAGARPDWMEPFARTIDAAKKYVVSSTLARVDWN